jgi:isoleucyl-tRNA synthetase
MVIVSSEKVCRNLKNIEDVLLELANVKTVEYVVNEPSYVSSKEWVSASEDNIKVFLNVHRDKNLIGQGLMRDLARRVQSLRKELGYMPTDILETIYIAELQEESIRLVRPHLKEMEELVRAKKILLVDKRKEVEAEWHEYKLNDKRVYIAIS